MLTETESIPFSFYFNFDICLFVTFCIAWPPFGNRLQKLQPQHPTSTQAVPVQKLFTTHRGEKEASSNLHICQEQNRLK